jgi:hypothetical protein
MMIPALGRYPLFESAEEGAHCPYCDSTDYVLVLRDSDEWTACALCIYRSLDLPFGWNLSRSLENAIRARTAAYQIAPRRRV